MASDYLLTANNALCKHPELVFEREGFYVHCPACSQLWQAIRPAGAPGKYEPGLRAGAASNIPRTEKRRPGGDD